MAAFGIFFNQGEVCSANSRLLVQRPIAEAFIEKMKERAGRHVPGNPLDPATSMGAIVDEKQTARIAEFLDHGRANARLVAGGNRVTVDGKGCFIEPSIFADVAPGDRLRAGTVSVTTVDALSPMTPFGGFKQSGVGRDLSLNAFDKGSGLKTAWVKY